MERRVGNEGSEVVIEKDDVDDVDSSVCETDEEVRMFLSMEEDVEGEMDKKRDVMGRRRGVRGRETRRLAMVDGKSGCASAQEFVEKVGTQQEDVALAFRERVQAAAEASREHQTGSATGTAVQNAQAEAENNGLPSFEFAKPRRHSAFYTPGPHDLLERPSNLRRASMTFSPSRTPSSSDGPSLAPDPSWLKAYNNVIGKAHFVERRNSLGKGGVLHARVQKKICGRRGG